jgi:hypothetical protein
MKIWQAHLQLLLSRKYVLKKTALMGFLTCLFFVSCEKEEWSNVGFEPITEAMIYDSITPAFNHDYFEIREFACWDTLNYRVKYYEGSYPLADSIFCDEGIDYSVGDYCGFCNVLSFNGVVPTFWKTYEDVVYFLAPIDSYGEALFLAHLRGYTFRFNDKGFGIKKENGKYYLKVLKLVLLCDPIQTDQFFLEIDEAGKIKVIDQKVYSRLIGACI